MVSKIHYSNAKRFFANRDCNYICKKNYDGLVPSLITPPDNWSYGACLEDEGSLKRSSTFHDSNTFHKTRK